MTRVSRFALILGAAYLGLPAAQAADRSGEAVWERHCLGCHRPDDQGPGTSMLRNRFGDARADVASNPDLDRSYAKQVVRNGFLEMAPFRKTEISDGELDALMDYLLND